eukprot:jgi/Bigna1/77139/fgenesh1_pg.46_\
MGFSPVSFLLLFLLLLLLGFGGGAVWVIDSGEAARYQLAAAQVVQQGQVHPSGREGVGKDDPDDWPYRPTFQVGGNVWGQHHVQGPYLVISPLSALPAWQREFKKWAPYLNTVVYNGNTYSRQILRDFEVFGHKIAGGFRATKTDVLLTTYEFATKDKYHLNKLQWKHLLVDEAHRLKNPKAQLYKVLSSMSFAGKVLITGTPLQNSMKELWALLNFLHPKKFGTVEDFEETYQGMHDEKDGKTIQKLHTMLEPYLIRRIKKDVLKSLPKKIERILHVEMSALQKKFYAWILARNYKALNQSQAGRLKGSAAAANRSSLMHTLTELKKCCNHCYLFPSGI